MIKPIVQQNMTDEVFNQMFLLLQEKKWKEGEKLPSENELKDLFGVSRNTVRTALNRLSIIGIVETRRGEGNFVKKVGVGVYMNSLIPHIFHNDNDIYTIMEFRKGIEVQSARLAGERANEEEILEIKQAQIECCREGITIENYMPVDMSFHLAIAKASHNDLIYQAMSIIKNYCYAALRNFNTPRIKNKSCEYHQQIYESIKAHKSEDAASFMNAHLTDVYTQIDNNRKNKLKENLNNGQS